MKKSVLVLSLVGLIFASCGDSKKKEIKNEVESTKEVVKKDAPSSDDAVVLGKKLFTEKTCSTCHQTNAKVIGPSIVDINKVYSEKNGDMVKFLRGENDAIVDTDPGQVAIMKANLEGFVKDLSDEEVAAIVAYMKSVN